MKGYMLKAFIILTANIVIGLANVIVETWLFCGKITSLINIVGRKVVGVCIGKILQKE